MRTKPVLASFLLAPLLTGCPQDNPDSRPCPNGGGTLQAIITSSTANIAHARFDAVSVEGGFISDARKTTITAHSSITPDHCATSPSITIYLLDRPDALGTHAITADACSGETPSPGNACILFADATTTGDGGVDGQWVSVEGGTVTLATADHGAMTFNARSTMTFIGGTRGAGRFTLDLQGAVDAIVSE